ncbi:MAG TPA: asparagine synthase-related protein, partial [Verrucomicrobiales bacterium]|nr:asparagine synthase-related protein [Verrucomicrobiales bacterium]
LYEPTPDAVAVRTYLHAGYVPSPLTGFEGVSKIPPGGWLTVEDGVIREGRFWLPRFRSDGPSRTEAEHVDHLRQLIEAAISSHLDADVPVGLFISGGLDSSTIALSAAGLHPQRLKSYSIVFPEDPGADESRFSRLIAGRIGSDHHEIEFRLDDLPGILSKVARAVEEPSLRSPWVLDHLLAKHASTGVKAVLTGEGADELFGGYPWLRNRPYSVGESFNGFFPRRLAGSLATRLRDYRARRGFRALAAPDRRALDLEWYRHLSPALTDDCLSPDFTSIEPNLDLLLPAPEILASCSDRLQRRLAIELWGRLPDGILMPSDKVSMTHSLELRMPFLDHPIVDYALGLPSKLKIKRRSEKHILKLASGVPQEIVTRQKFGLRYGSVIGPVFARMARDTILDARDLCPYIQRDTVETGLAKDGVSHWVLIHLVMLQCWWGECMKSEAVRV